MQMALQRKEYAVVDVLAPGVADSSPWKWSLQGLETVAPGARSGHSRGWNGDKEALIDRQWSLHCATMEYSLRDDGASVARQ